MDAIYYDTQSYTTEDVRTRRGVCVRKATKDDDICLSSFLLVYLVCTGSPRIRRLLSCLFELGFRQFGHLYGFGFIIDT